MAEPLALLTAGTLVTVHLRDGSTHQGQVQVHGGGWLQLNAAAGGLLINLDQVAMIALGPAQAAAAPTPIDHPLPRPQSKDIPVKAGSRAPGRPWQDDDLRALADGFLAGSTEAALGERFHRTRGAIRVLRQGFECARGAIMEDDADDVARSWIARWRRVLGGAQ